VVIDKTKELFSRFVWSFLLFFLSLRNRKITFFKDTIVNKNKNKIVKMIA